MVGRCPRRHLGGASPFSLPSLSPRAPTAPLPLMKSTHHMIQVLHMLCLSHASMHSCGVVMTLAVALEVLCVFLLKKKVEKEEDRRMSIVAMCGLLQRKQHLFHFK